MGLRSDFAPLPASALLAGLLLLPGVASRTAAAQTPGSQSTTAVNLSPDLLPQSFGSFTQNPGAPSTDTSTISLSGNVTALSEDGAQRSQVAHYTRPNGAPLTVEAVQFGDRSGAFSAFTLVRRPDMKPAADLGLADAVGQNTVLFYQGTSLVEAYPATQADIPALKPLADALPKVSGNKNVAPLLPSFLPAKGIVNGSVRYALGPATYAAQGGVLPANSIGWDKSAEAVTATLDDKRGHETLTLLLYPTPTIAGAHQHAIEHALSSLGPSFTDARVRRDHELVMLANGSFSADQAQKLLENIHMNQQLSFDKDVQPVFHVEVQKTASLLVNIAVLFGVLGLAAVLLGLFLGGGRALIRMLRGKSAAVEPEFLSLQLDHQNKPVRFDL